MNNNTNKFETIYEVGSVKSKHYMEIFRFNEHKFKINFEHSNGTPCGFNYKCSLSIMLPDGTFHYLVDNHDLEIGWKNNYISSENSVETSNMNRIAQREFKNYVNKVYA